MDSATLKELLYEHCERFVEERISNIQQAMENARAAQQDDTKSSAGDKYETTREMMTQELENLSTQLHQLLVQRNMLQSMQLDKKNVRAEAGSLVETDKGFSISLGLHNFQLSFYMKLIHLMLAGQTTDLRIRFPNILVCLRIISTK